MTEFAIRRAHPGDETAIATVQICAWKETYRDILPAHLVLPWKITELTSLWQRRIRLAERAATTIVGTDDTGTIVGFGICGDNRGSALPARTEIALLYILPKVQRHGLGRRLMRSLASSADARGHATTGLWVLSANTAAIRFYQSLGGIRAVQRVGLFGGYATHEHGFIWPTSLLARSGSLKGVNAARK